MRYMKLNKHDIANGDGVRVSLWVSGCSRHCKGCFNEEAWNFQAGNDFGYDVKTEIIQALRPDYISGITILGGEPLAPENILAVETLVKLIRYIFKDTKTIWIYTGYTYEEVKDEPILDRVDILVDGPFIEDEKDISLKFRGSRNQRILNMKEMREEHGRR